MPDQQTKTPRCPEEVEATVADYLHMWLLEQAGQGYSKTAHRNILLQKLNNRSAAAVEMKHQNISAVLMEHGWQNIPGYKPRGNYQRLLAEVVAERIMRDHQFDHAAEVAASQPAIAPLLSAYDGVMVGRPKFMPSAESKRVPYFVVHNPQLKRDYLGREARNTLLGKAGEEFVVAFEQRRLHTAGRRALAEKVEHVASTKGDGLGFDVQSFDLDGRDRFIEVKITAWGKETPFFISQNELAFSKEYSDHFHLYRVFEFRKSPHLFDLPGAVERHCHLDPVTYAARFS
jgi:Domain of unknown function (DUF3883)